METIIFDVDDTMYDQALSFHRTFKKMFAEPLTYEELDRLYRASRKYSEILFDQSEKGQITQAEWQTGRITRAWEDFGIPIDEEKAAAFQETYVAEQKNIALFPEVEQLLNHLTEEGKQLAILTNGEAGHQAMKIEQLGLNRWVAEEHTFISGTIGHAKPKQEVFTFVEEKLGLNKEKTVYIGDSFEKDVIGAKQAGWQAVWMNHRRRKVPADAAFRADREVYDAAELLQVFVK